MHRSTLVFTILLSLSTCIAPVRAAEPEGARKILETAVKEAEASHRPVFLIFHASWCTWCKKLDAVIETPDVKKLIDAHYVVVHLDVQERGEKIQALENPGGREIMSDLGGSDSGLPFYAFLDGKGKKIADSMIEGPKNENIGFPGSELEIALFDRLLKETAPRMSADERALVTKHFPRQGT
jgi:thioredoxin-related protein